MSTVFVDCELHVLHIAQVLADAHEVQKELGAHGADHVRPSRIDLFALRDTRTPLEGNRKITVPQYEVLLFLADLL